VHNFLRDHVEAGVFAPDAVRSLVAAFDGAWQSIKASGARLSDKQIELVRATLAKSIIEQARHGELDQSRLRDGALQHLARSNLRYPPRDRK
jgi:ABC-type nitrate/sulfonate/bicarbonate transport system substrate-binding protein